MKELNFIPYNLLKGETNYRAVYGVYLDGDLEDDTKYDIPVVQGLKESSLPTGIYPVTVKGANPNRECVAFVWECIASWNFGSPTRGYIVYKDDKDAYKSALKFYKNKSNF